MFHVSPLVPPAMRTLPSCRTPSAGPLARPTVRFFCSHVDWRPPAWYVNPPASVAVVPLRVTVTPWGPTGPGGVWMRRVPGSTYSVGAWASAIDTVIPCANPAPSSFT